MNEEEAIKLLELGPEAWMSGISLQPSFPVAGIFRQASNFDPFKTMGVFSPAIGPTQQGSASITQAGVFNVGFEVAGASYFYSFGDGTKVYRVNTINTLGDVDDVSSSISDIAVIRGAVKHKNKVVYASNTSLKFNNTDTSTPGDGFTRANQRGLISLTTGGVHVLITGPDRNLYVSNINKIGRITTMTGETAGVPASGNTNSYLTFEDDVIIRDLSTDGKYLVILGDTNNTWTSGSNTKVRSFVAFWNMKSQDLTQIWEFEDTVTYGLEYTGEEFIVHGRDNVYTCSIDSPIEPLIPRRGSTNITQSIVYAGGIVRRNGSVLWGEGSNIYAYGRPHKSLKKVFYHPYTVSSGSVVSLFADGATIWAMTDDHKLYDFSSGSQADSSLLRLSDLDFKKPYRFAFAKIILRDPLASGDSLALQINTQNANKLVLNSNGMDFADDGAISSKVIYPEASISGGVSASANTLLFEDLTFITLTNTNGCNVRRVEIWAYPVTEGQNLGY